MALNEKQKKFAEEWIIDFNGKQAAIRTGYSEKTAEVKASQLLSLVKVQDYIGELRKAQQERTEITADMVIKELGKIAFSDIRDIYDTEGRMLLPHELDENTAATISGFKTRFEGTINTDSNGSVKGADIIEEYKRHDKTKALELLGKHFAIFTDKVEHGGGLKVDQKWEIEFIEADK